MLPVNAISIWIDDTLILIFRNKTEFKEALEKNNHLTPIFGASDAENQLFPDLYIAKKEKNIKGSDEIEKDLISNIIIELQESASKMNSSETDGGIGSNKVNIGKTRAYTKVLQMLGCNVEMKSQYVSKTASYGYVDELKVNGELLEIKQPEQWRDMLPY